MLLEFLRAHDCFMELVKFCNRVTYLLKEMEKVTDFDSGTCKLCYIAIHKTVTQVQTCCRFLTVVFKLKFCVNHVMFAFHTIRIVTKHCITQITSLYSCIPCLCKG